MTVTALNTSPDSSTQRVPTTGMRGGLGRTFLTAFLILAIIPPSLVGFLAYTRVQNDQQQRVLDRLTTIADLSGAQLEDWGKERAVGLKAIAQTIQDDNFAEWLQANPLVSKLAESQVYDLPIYHQDLESVWLQDARADRTWLIHGADSRWHFACCHQDPSRLQDTSPASPASVSFFTVLALGPDGVARFLLIVPLVVSKESEMYIIGVAKIPERFFTGSLFNSVAHTAHLYLSNQDGQIFSLDGRLAPRGDPRIPPQPVPAAKLDVIGNIGRDWHGVYVNQAGQPVVGIYHWLPLMNCALIAEQDQATAMAISDQFAASLIAAILGVALLTTLVAAAVTRQMTRPIVRLTEVALRMAEGDLSQRVQPHRQDEIGILARVFNKMAADLGELYSGLEKKVTERTRELQEAKEQIQYHAWQLSISAEVGRITTSILDLDTLLEKAAQLIRDAFQLDHVGIYLLGPSSDIAILRKHAGRAVPDYERQIRVGGTHPVSWVISQRMWRTITKFQSNGLHGNCHELVLPLSLGAKVIGALDLTTYDPAGFGESDQDVLQALADQLTVAVENARAYGREHTFASEMREVDRLRGQFLARMSHQLATYLNNIIGFSQLILKGVDGPTTEAQIRDMTIVRQSGSQLLQLLYDIHELADLEAGTIEMQLAPVNLPSFMDDLQAMLPAALVNPRVQLEIWVGSDLPTVMADANRLRQVLTNLVMTAAEMSHDGMMKLLVTRHAPQNGNNREYLQDDSGRVMFALNAPAMWDAAEGDRGISLALSRRLIELHGGRLRVEQHSQNLTVFSFSLPVNTSASLNHEEQEAR